MQVRRRCHQEKAINAFVSGNRVCKACWAAHKKKHQYRTDPRVKELRALNMVRPEGRAVHLLNGAKSRSRKYRLEFSLSVSFITEALKQGVCPKTGLPFDLSPAEDTRYHPLAPSLDRIDKTKGYVADSVQVVCNWYNIAKNEFTENQLLAFCRAVIRTADRD